MRHGLRVSEAIALRWDQVDLKQGRASVTMTTDAELPTGLGIATGLLRVVGVAET